MPRIIVPIVNRLTEPAITIVDGRQNLLSPSWAGTVLSAPIAPVAGCGRVAVIAKIREESGESPNNYGFIEMISYPDTGNFAPAESALFLGNADGWYHVWHRYIGLNIPKGASITTCYLSILATGSNSYYEDHVIRINVSFHAADAAAIPVSISHFFGLDRTDPVAWENLPVWEDGLTYQSPDLSESLQQVVDREGYEAGNPIMVIIDDNGSDTVESRGGNNQTMQLVVGWS